MADIGFHASHEQFPPSELLKLVQLAEQAGFQAVNCSDHFKPWSKRQGQSGFSFAWLGAAMQASQLPFGVVCTPGYRYHPAIVAQAIATLCEMFPGRFWVSLGSGEAMNERLTGEKWPRKHERNARLRECADIIKRLLHGETVNHNGLIVAEDAKLFTLPKIQPLLLGAAVTKETAEWLGSWADGMITINHPIEQMEGIISAFRRGGGRGKPVYIKCQLSYARTEEAALMGAHDQWRTNIFSGTVLSELWTVEQFDAAGEFVQPEELKKMVLISADLEYLKERIGEYAALGVDRIILHNVNREQEFFIRQFGEKVLPSLR
jgi:coenzyme F420-dependent glucose-6-phosphate dehydrogenase